VLSQRASQALIKQQHRGMITSSVVKCLPVCTFASGGTILEGFLIHAYSIENGLRVPDELCAHEPGP
jgi:hypothetical protein